MKFLNLSVCIVVFSLLSVKACLTCRILEENEKGRVFQGPYTMGSMRTNETEEKCSTLSLGEKKKCQNEIKGENENPCRSIDDFGKLEEDIKKNFNINPDKTEGKEKEGNCHLYGM